MDFDNKDESKYSSLSEINRLKRDLIPENFIPIENKNNSMSLTNKNYDLNILDHNEEEQKSNKSNDNNNNNENINNENIKNENNSKKTEEEGKEKLIPEEIKNNEEEKIEIEEEQEKNKEKKIPDLIPLWYKCLNKEHAEKYITLDRKKTSLICKNCYMSGALETNLELNQEFIDNYLKEQELRNMSKQTPNNVIKETPEENIVSESEENANKSSIS
jgi:hypothetical protein